MVVDLAATVARERREKLPVAEYASLWALATVYDKPVVHRANTYQAMKKKDNLTKKFECLKDILLSMKSVLVAYSGGVDSTFLLKISSNLLKDNVFAVTANSSTFPSREMTLATDMAKSLKVKLKAF